MAAKNVVVQSPEMLQRLKTLMGSVSGLARWAGAQFRFARLDPVKRNHAPR